MARSTATTPAAYLAELPADRRAVIAAVRDVILKHLPKGYEECVAYGMLGYVVPLATYPDTYNGQPLIYTALAAQKNAYSLYMMSVYENSEAEEALREGFAKRGKKLDMGKSCIRFKKLEDLPLDVVAKLVKMYTVKKFIAAYEAARAR